MASSATISLLPVSLSLVHIPRSRIRDQLHPILRQLLLPAPTFLNVTSNEIELSIFAEHHTLQDLQVTARRDACVKPVGRERPSSKDRRRLSNREEWEPIEVSQERWNVLQIDSHAEGLGQYDYCSTTCSVTILIQHCHSLHRHLRCSRS